MKNWPFIVSIMVPTYNSSAFIGELLESIIGQIDISLHDIQVIITDDASTDNTIDIVMLYKKDIPNLFINKNEINLGITKNCNVGLSYCTGKYWMGASGDDVLSLDRISSQLNWFKQNPDGVLCSSGVEVFEHESGKILGRYIDKDFLYQRPKEYIIAQENQLASARFMFNTEKLPTLRYDERTPVVSDWLFVNEALFYGSYGDTGKIGVRYRRHANNTTRKGINHFYMEDRLIAIDILLCRYPEVYNACKRQRAYTFYNYAKRCYLAGEMALAKQFSLYALRENTWQIKPILLFMLSYLGPLGDKIVQRLRTRQPIV